MTEYEYYSKVNEVAAKFGLTEKQAQYVKLYCAENGYDCGDNCWQVAFDTLEMIIDQDQLILVANNEI